MIASILYFSGNPKEISADDSTAETVSAPENPNEAQLLIRDLLNQRNWATDANQAAFIEKWQALSADTRSAAMGSLEINELTTEIYKQLLKERALSGIGNAEEAQAKQKKLIEFAHKVGIKDPKIAMPE